ncbi:unnamed protein product [Polarella glacialis]|uniref:Uncharacterized protein n=1 Tax=Polarella glacialis TaxID=89957 RepID=A0A813L847_POLGL|nr:unnamed protein product [Polarella glacialis]
MHGNAGLVAREARGWLDGAGDAGGASAIHGYGAANGGSLSAREFGTGWHSQSPAPGGGSLTGQQNAHGLESHGTQQGGSRGAAEGHHLFNGRYSWGADSRCVYSA